jgi:hypothetical protein
MNLKEEESKEALNYVTGPSPIKVSLSQAYCKSEEHTIPDDVNEDEEEDDQ